MKSASLHFTSDHFIDGDDTDSIKFGLYVKTHELKQITESLQQVMLLTSKNRHKWASDNSLFIDQLLDNFLGDSALALDGLQLDPEAMQLSKEYVVSLRDAMNTLQTIVQDARKLKN